MLFPSILECIGHTPTVQLQRVGSELDCSLYVKCEFLNPGGSIKDRIALTMIEEAERLGHIRPGDTLIEATSGNTGIGLALVAAVKGYPIIITMPEKNSLEKQVVLESLGAIIYRTPNVPLDHPDNYITLARRLQQNLPRAHMLNQFTNPNNPLTHYHTTAQEIIDTFDGDIDMVVMSMGTGGTITGVSERLKQHNPHIQIIGVDPCGSIMTGQKNKKPYLVEGIGSDFVPEIFKDHLIDRIIYTEDAEAFHMARRLIAEEGLLIGGSSGSAVSAMLQAAESLGKHQRAVAILPDSIRNYISKFANKDWMENKGFIEKVPAEKTAL